MENRINTLLDNNYHETDLNAEIIIVFKDISNRLSTFFNIII